MDLGGSDEERTRRRHSWQAWRIIRTGVGQREVSQVPSGPWADALENPAEEQVYVCVCGKRGKDQTSRSRLST